MALPQTKLQISDQEVILTVLTGPEAGVAYKLMGQNITLGRANENDVVLQDAKSSRAHAVIERRGDQYWVRDLESKTGVVVNGKSAKESPLQAGDQILIGETKLRFGYPQPLSLVNAPPVPQMGSTLPLTKNSHLGVAGPTFGAPGPWPSTAPINGPSKQNSRRPGPRRHEQNKNLIPALIIAIIVIGFVAIQKSSSPHHHKGVAIKGDADFDEQLEVTTEANDKAQQEILRKGKDTQQYSEAQSFYLRGFREFRENNYGRAIQNFQAALALYPNHPLAKRYLERSILKNSELVTAALQRGEKDFQLERYNNAFNEYRTVILLTNDSRNKDYQLAEKRIEAIQLILVNSK